MTKHDDLPEILQAEWSRDQVMALFADLAAGAEVVHVQLRTAAGESTVSLASAASAFAASEASAIQVRYRYEGEGWCDTIMPADPTTKIIRTRMGAAKP